MESVPNTYYETLWVVKYIPRFDFQIYTLQSLGCFIDSKEQTMLVQFSLKYPSAPIYILNKRTLQPVISAYSLSAAGIFFTEKDFKKIIKIKAIKWKRKTS